MLKRIPKSDISIRPFKAYKEWNFSSGSNEITLLEANISSSELSNGYPKNSIYGQLRAQFYNGLEDNPFLRFGSKSNVYNPSVISKERFLSNDAKVISIPQIYVGEGIKKGSVSISESGITMIDDSDGNLILLGDDIINFQTYNIQFPHNYTFLLGDNYYTAKINSIDIESQTLIWEYNGDVYDAVIMSFDIMTGDMIVDNVDFASASDTVQRAGNVFYNAGLIVMTRTPEERLLGNWDLSYKSTKTIYEHEYLLIVNEDEFNVSQNPSAVVTEGGEYSTFVDSSGNTHRVYSKQPVKYIRKKSILENGNTLDYRYTSSVSSSTHFAGFEHWDLSSSIDSTGSFLTPFITTIGLYDDNCDLVAVAKLPQPIKSERDLPVNFIVRFDT